MVKQKNSRLQNTALVIAGLFSILMFIALPKEEAIQTSQDNGQSSGNMDEAVFISARFDNPHSRTPRIVGNTNLPNETILNIALRSPELQFFDGENVSVRNGSFVTKKLGNGRALSPGRYELLIVMPLADLQPESVQRIVGLNGEYLKGPLVINKYGVNVVSFDQMIDLLR